MQLVEFIFSLGKKSLAKEIVIYGIGNVLFAVAQLLITLLLTRYFSLYKYGAIDLIYTTILIISLCANLGLDSALLRFYYDSNHKKGVLATSILAISVISALAFCLITFLFFVFFKGFMFRTVEEKEALFIALLSVPFMVCLMNQFMLLRLERKAGVFLLLSVVYVLLTPFLTAFFMQFSYLGIRSFFIALLISHATVSGVGFLCLRKNFSLSLLSLDIKSQLLLYSLPLLIPALLGTFLGSINKYILQFYKGLAAVGIYGIGIKIGSILGLIGMSFRQAWIPYAFSIMDKGEAKRKYNLGFRIFITVLFALAFLVVLFSKQIILLVSSPKYLAAQAVIGYICLGVIFINLAGNFFNFGLLIKKRTFYSFLSYIIGLFINVILAIILVPRFSFVGASVSMLFGYFTTAILLLYFSETMHKIQYDLKFLFGLLFIYSLFLIIWVNK